MSTWERLPKESNEASLSEETHSKAPCSLPTALSLLAHLVLVVTSGTQVIQTLESHVAKSAKMLTQQATCPLGPCT